MHFFLIRGRLFFQMHEAKDCNLMKLTPQWGNVLANPIAHKTIYLGRSRGYCYYDLCDLCPGKRCQ